MSQEEGPHVGTAVASGRTPSRPGPERQPTNLGHGAAAERINFSNDRERLRPMLHVSL